MTKQKSWRNKQYQISLQMQIINVCLIPILHIFFTTKEKTIQLTKALICKMPLKHMTKL